MRLNELACKACVAAIFYIEEPYPVIYCIYCFFFYIAGIGELKLEDLDINAVSFKRMCWSVIAFYDI